MTQQTTDAAAVEADAVLLMRARRRLRELAVQLEIAPFAPQTTQALRTYLEDEAESAAAAFARWRELPGGVRRQEAGRMREARS
ncbi:hypothetical protein RCO28_34215 [Streptomyces sp. LHD-70]|uniref:hypothetical protein n=1 Tax=Streptomyces sp. LHD-70 TaxID=3072140 RepID=UPI00280CBB72|nr:hypothetical protein [Streptomyces sp. LHD-70]MDQ8707488.1 hypothetical protein [Streptomyces sp. LHD-70]